MRASWSIIACINAAFVASLLVTRRKDHPALLPFFATYLLTDTFMFLADGRPNGGLGVIPLPHPVWVAVGTACWLSWFAVIPITALTLLRGKFNPLWLFYFGLPLVLISCSELLGQTCATRRMIAHWAYEPAVLTCGAFALFRYLYRDGRTGKLISDTKGFYLATAVLFTLAMMMLKVLLLLDSRLNYHRVASHGIYYTLMAFIVFTKIALPRYRRWLVRM